MSDFPSNNQQGYYGNRVDYVRVDPVTGAETPAVLDGTPVYQSANPDAYRVVNNTDGSFDVITTGAIGDFVVFVDIDGDPGTGVIPYHFEFTATVTDAGGVSPRLRIGELRARTT